MNQTFCDLKGIDHKGNGITSFNGWIIFSLAVEIENISLIHSKKMINRTKKKMTHCFLGNVKIAYTTLAQTACQELYFVSDCVMLFTVTSDQTYAILLPGSTQFPNPCGTIEEVPETCFHEQ